MGEDLPYQITKHHQAVLIKMVVCWHGTRQMNGSRSQNREFKRGSCMARNSGCDKVAFRNSMGTTGSRVSGPHRERRVAGTR